MNLSSGSGESSASSSNSQAEGENSQTEVKIGNQSNCDLESDNLQGTGPIQASGSPKSEKNSTEQHLHVLVSSATVLSCKCCSVLQGCCVSYLVWGQALTKG